jgi:hypothetical protein
MVTNKIVSAAPLDPYRIAVVFANGVRGIFNLEPYLNEGVFTKLRDEKLFRAVHVAYGTLVWPGEIDIAPDTVEADLIVGNEHEPLRAAEPPIAYASRPGKKKKR